MWTGLPPVSFQHDDVPAISIASESLSHFDRRARHFILKCIALYPEHVIGEFVLRKQRREDRSVRGRDPRQLAQRLAHKLSAEEVQT